MSEYTTELRFICEAEAGLSESKGYSNVASVIAAAIPKIFNFDFPIFNEEYRNVLCTKIIKHYYTREIGLETYGLWKLKLDTLMNEIMPYYNKMYESAELEYNPLYDADYTRTTNGDESGEDARTKSESGSNAKTGTVGEIGSSQVTNGNIQRFSDTPEGGLVGVLNDNYLTNVTKNDGNSNSSGSNTTTYNTNDSVTNSGTASGNFSTTKEYVEHVVGKFPGRSYAKTIKEYREALINVDLMVIDALGELFMKVW